MTNERLETLAGIKKANDNPPQKVIHNQRQQGKGAMQDILFMAYVRAVQDKMKFVIPHDGSLLEITVERVKADG